MKIKTKKQFRLDELIKYVWDNHLYPETYKSNFNDFAHFDKAGKYQLIEQKGINQATKFTVEVEEIVTPATIFNELTEYIYDYNDDHHFTAEHKGANINMIIDCETHHFKTQAIYCKNTLFWAKEHGIPESGVLEEGAE